MRPSTTYQHPDAHTYLDTTLRDPHHVRILTNLVDHFALRPGDSLVELGAGSGRYTEWLLDHGFSVTAVEPDPELLRKLERRLAGRPNLRLVPSDISVLQEETSEAQAICGFHVLHHLDARALRSLAATVTAVSARSARFAGWFFLEPNPLNPLYPLQILTTPAMQFKEEAGIWRRDYGELLGTIADGGGCTLGTMGLFPPRPVFDRLPDWLLRRGTTLKGGRSLVRLYTIYGALDASLRTSVT